MKYFTGFLVALFLIMGSVLLTPNGAGQAYAQISVQIGGDFGRAKQALVNQGYTQIRMVGQGFTKFQVEACQNGVRYWFKTDSRGRTNQKRQIGNCQSTLTIEQVQQLLASQGYTRINLEDRGGRYIAVACYRNDRVRIKINRVGQVGDRRVLGACQRKLNPADVTAELRRQGYTRIKFTQRRPPVFQAEACLGKRKFRLELDEFAQIISERNIGICRGPINAGRLADILKDRGFTNVVVIDDQLPRYVAEVCEGDRRFEITLNRYGDIIDRASTGSCAKRMDRRQLVKSMRNQGFRRINVKREHSRGYVVEACYEGQRLRLELSPSGELAGERNLGACAPYSITQVKERLSNRQFDDLEFYVQGCRRGKLIRFKLDEFGDRSGREVLGQCNR